MFSKVVKVQLIYHLSYTVFTPKQEVADPLASGWSMAGANFCREKNTKISLT